MIPALKHSRPTRALLAWLLIGSIGCAPAMTGYQPQHVGPAELTLRYEKGMKVFSGRSFLSAGPLYSGLPEHVRCVPQAYEHARYAQKHGRARRGLAWSGGALGVASLGGLSGFAFLEDDPKTAFALLGTGLGVAVLGVILAGASRSAGNQAHGNAIDAINYYNDAVGSVGGSCAQDVSNAPPLALLPAPTRMLQGPPSPEPSDSAVGPAAARTPAAKSDRLGPAPALGAFQHNGGLQRSGELRW